MIPQSDPINLDKLFPPKDDTPLDVKVVDTVDSVSFTATRHGKGLLVSVERAGNPSFRCEVELYDDDTERLYGLAYNAVRTRLADDAAAAMEPRLPRTINTVAPIGEPLRWFETGRKRVNDERGPNNWHGDNRLNIGAIEIHRVDCKKMLARSVLDRYKDGDWPDLVPAVAEGRAVPRMCLACKPLGRYSAAINARTEWSTYANPPAEMPTRIEGFNTRPEDSKVPKKAWKSQVLLRLGRMNPDRWEALAHLIIWCAAQQPDDIGL